jgi:ABC-type transport system substrate-binding protein
MKSNYWEQVLQQRVSRRRAIAAAGASAASAAFVAACGGGDDDSGGQPEDPSGLLARIPDDTNKLVRGGKGTWSHPTPVSLDPHLTGGQVAHCWHAYSQLFRFKEGHFEPASGEIEGELAEGYEFSADKTQLTVKLRRGALFAPIPPVNSREVDAQDVIFSWNRYEAISPRRAELSNKHNPSASVLSVEAPDNTTVLIKLKEPNATILGGFAGNLPGTPFVVPREVEPAGINLRERSLGSGAFYLTEYEPGFRAVYKANPGFKSVDDRELPYVDEMEYLEIPDYPAFLAQFKAGQVLNQFFGVMADDILQTRADVPQLEVFDGGLSAGQTRTLFGRAGNSPFKDERVRQAVTRSYDRDLFTEVAFATRQFEDMGVPIDKPWDSAIPAAVAYAGWWLDPRGSELGPDAKNYQYDVAEAKKLMAAAGHTSGVDVKVTWGDAFPAFFQARREILMGMLESSGLFRLTSNQISFATEWNPVFRNNKGQFEGLAMTLDTNELDAAVDLYSHYHPEGSRNFGSDQELKRLTEAMLREFDVKKRVELSHDLQRHEAKVQALPAITSATGLRIKWPAERIIRNTVWRGNPNRWHAHTWLDFTKAPLA